MSKVDIVRAAMVQAMKDKNKERKEWNRKNWFYVKAVQCHW